MEKVNGKDIVLKKFDDAIIELSKAIKDYQELMLDTKEGIMTLQLSTQILMLSALRILMEDKI